MPGTEALLSLAGGHTARRDDPTSTIDESTRERLFEYLGDDFAHLRTNPLWTASEMTSYMTKFWVDLHETQPGAIHRPTFQTTTAPAPLLWAMISLGCYYAEDPGAHDMALKIHPVLRGKVVTSDDFQARAQLFVHQTLVLVIIFGSRMGTQQMHEMAHIFWPSVLTVGRRSAIHSERVVQLRDKDRDDRDAQWAAWIEEESAKRVGYILFTIDVQRESPLHSVTS